MKAVLTADRALSFLRPVLVAALLLACAGPARARHLVLESFDATIVVLPSGTVDLTETIRARFVGSWRGLYRTIPVEYRTPQGFNYTLLLDPVSVTDEAGKALKYDSSRERHYRKFKIYVPGAQDVTRTIILRYRVRNALKFFEDHDELYWNVTGDEWDIPIESASASIVLPAGVTGLRATTFTGAYGSREQDADVRIGGNGVEIRMRRRLAFREGLTAVVGWDKDVVKEPGVVTKGALFLRSNWPLVIPIAVFALMYRLWSTRGRDPRLRPITVQYEPPTGLSPAETGTLVDNSADMRDITSTIVDLAVRGYVLIEEVEKERLLGLWSNKEYVFHLRKRPDEWKELKPHERELLSSLFAGGLHESRELSDLQNKFYKHLPGIRDRIFDGLMNQRYYSQRPDKVKKAYLIGGVILGAVMVWGAGGISAATGMAPFTFIVAGVLTGAIICGFGWFMPARTLAGARALESARGFEDFLGRVEADRFERMVRTPEMFEKFLPYAMALGVESRWVAAFQDIYTQPPQWYRGTGYGPHFHPSGFVNDLSRMSARAGAVLASAPRSSGGSGFGGGGSSGGGFGGGGGGGF